MASTQTKRRKGAKKARSARGARASAKKPTASRAKSRLKTKAAGKRRGTRSRPTLAVPKRGKKLYEGKAKILYATSDPDKLICYFKDDATAFNAQKKGTIVGKGGFNNEISALLLGRLARKGVPTHLLGRLSEREQLVRRVEIIPLEVIVRNIVAGSLAQRLGVPEGGRLTQPAVEFCYKSDEQGDPFVSGDIAVGLGWARPREITYLHETALRVNGFLSRFFDGLGIDLVDFKLEFGRFGRKLLLADEITPDGCRLWEKKTGEKLDKDRFRRDLGGVEQAYERVRDAVRSAA